MLITNKATKTLKHQLTYWQTDQFTKKAKWFQKIEHSSTHKIRYEVFSFLVTAPQSDWPADYVAKWPIDIITGWLYSKSN